MRCKRNAYLATAAASLIVGLGGCSGSQDDAAAVRVAGRPISTATVDHWTEVVRRGGGFTPIRGEPHGGTARQRALAVLLAFEWLRGEAAREGLPISGRAVDEAVAERTRGQAGDEFRRRLATTGQDLPGFRLELEAEMALEAIRRWLAQRIAHVTEADVRAFYRSNPTLFGQVPEGRVVDIVEHIPGAPAARALVRRVGTGPRFTRLAYHKKIVLSPGVLNGPTTKKAVDYAIFAARPGVASQPKRFGDAWAVFVVRKVLPARPPKPLAEVRAKAVTALSSYRKRTITDAFEAGYRKRWTVRTSCSSGYIVPNCRDYHGRPTPNEVTFAES